MIDETTINKLNMLHDTLQPFIDEVARKRQSATSDKYLWSYVSKKLDLAGKAVGMALDKIDEEKNKYYEQLSETYGISKQAAKRIDEEFDKEFKTNT